MTMEERIKRLEELYLAIALEKNPEQEEEYGRRYNLHWFALLDEIERAA